jgi:hypothetical protein
MAITAASTARKTPVLRGFLVGADEVRSSTETLSTGELLPLLYHGGPIMKTSIDDEPFAVSG